MNAYDYNDEGGVIVARVPASPEAPHGVKDKKRYRVHVRRGEEKKPLDMRDIQLHTLETRRRSDAVEQRIEARRAAFQRTSFAEAEAPVSGGYRITVTPARAIYRVMSLEKNAVRPARKSQQWYVTPDQGRPRQALSCIDLAFNRYGFRPCLRGVTAQNHSWDYGLITFSAFEDGTVDAAVMPPTESPFINAWDVLSDLLTVVDVATTMRESAGAGRAELLIDVEFAYVGSDPTESDPTASGMELVVGIEGYMSRGARRQLQTPLRFPRYALVEKGDIQRVAAEFWQDLCDVGGSTGLPSLADVERVGR